MPTITIKDHTWQVILNPNAYAGKSKKHWVTIATKLDELQIAYQVHPANQANAGREIVKQLCLDGKRHFIIIGGDGTVNEVVNGIAISGINTSEAFIVPFPIGTGNDWVRTHQYPKDYNQLFNPLLAGQFQRHDMGIVKTMQDDQVIDSRYFINIAGFCFDAAVIHNAPEKKPLFSSAVYLWSLLKTLLTYKAQPVTVKTDNEEFNKPIFTMAVGIGKYNGNGMMQVPMGNPFDGLFDVMVIDKISKLKVLANVLNLFSGKHIALPEVSVHQTKELEIKSTPPVFGEVEGELLATGNYKISIIPEAVNVLVME